MPYRSLLELDISAPEMKRAILDRDHLDRYTMGCPDLERELIRLFLDQVPDLTRQLESDLDAEDWKFVTHTLKGSARAIGATMIAELAQRLEEIGPDSCDRERFETIVRLKAAVSAFRIEVGEARSDA